MSGHKVQRVSEDIKRELTAILRELKDFRVKDSLISIVRIELSNDLSFCKVYVSAMEGLEKAKSAVEGLKSASGYIKHQLGLRLDIRHIPTLKFIATDSIEYSAHISKVLNDLKG